MERSLTAMDVSRWRRRGLHRRFLALASVTLVAGALAMLATRRPTGSRRRGITSRRAGQAMTPLITEESTCLPHDTQIQAVAAN